MMPLRKKGCGQSGQAFNRAGFARFFARPETVNSGTRSREISLPITLNRMLAHSARREHSRRNLRSNHLRRTAAGQRIAALDTAVLSHSCRQASHRPADPELSPPGAAFLPTGAVPIHRGRRDTKSFEIPDCLKGHH